MIRPIATAATICTVGRKRAESQAARKEALYILVVRPWNSFVFSSSRSRALTTRTPWKFSLNAPVIFEFVRRETRYSTRILLRNWTAIKTITGIAAETINASLQLIIAIKINEVVMFMIAQVVSTTPQVSNSETRPVSDVTRAMR